jgi:hypothetical protein
MFRQPDVIRCEDCALLVPLARSQATEAGLVCDECAHARATAPPIFTPVWTRLRRAVGLKN